jgi:hypothetical protein
VSDDDDSAENVNESDSKDANNDRAGTSTSKCVRKKKTDWVWVIKEKNPIINQFSAHTGVSELLSNKYENDATSEISIFLDYMDPLFSVTVRETNNYGQKQLADAGRRKEKKTMTGALIQQSTK